MYPRLELKAYKWYLPIGWCCRSQDCGEGTWARNIAPCFQGSLAARTPLKHWPCAPSWSEPGTMFLKCLQLVSAVSPSPESSQELSFKGRLWPISFFEITEQASVSSLPSQQLDEEFCVTPASFPHSYTVSAPGCLFVNWSICSRVFRSKFGVLKGLTAAQPR